MVTDPGVINPKDFIDTVVNVRLPNPFMPDAPQRIATDTSQKLAIRFGETIKAYLASDSLNVHDLKAIPLVLAGWLRYLMAIDDNGQPFELSTDPLLDDVRPYVADIRLGEPLPAAALKTKLEGLLRNAAIFGVDLIDAGLADLVCENFSKLLVGPGAVRETLKAL